MNSAPGADSGDHTSSDAASDLGDEKSPDSSKLRVSRNTANESGIPPARDEEAAPALRGIEHLERAVVAVAKSEAQLAVLERGLRHATLAASSAAEANLQLLQELDALHAELARKEGEQAILRQRVSLLDTTLERTRSEAKREREFLTVEQDRFLAEILTDQDQAIDALRAHVADLSAQVTALVAELDAVREPATVAAPASSESSAPSGAGASVTAVDDAAPTHRTPPSSDAPVPGRDYDRRSPSSGSVIGSVSLRQIRVSSSPAMPATDGAKRALIEELLEDNKAHDPRTH